MHLDLDVDKEENAKLGVYWLTKASEQGNLEATDILRKCLATGRGITQHNYYDVKTCLDMTQDEKLARRAAREMFTRYKKLNFINKINKYLFICTCV